MNIDDQAFARSLAKLRPAKAEMDPAGLFYQAGFAAGEAGTKSRERLLLRTAALALLAVGLAAGGGFYAGHQRGERVGYLAAVQPLDVAPAVIAPRNDSFSETHGVEAPELEETPDAPLEKPLDSVPQPKARSREPRLAVSEAPDWAWIFQQFAPQSPLAIEGGMPGHSSLAIGATTEQWEELSDFRKPPERLPQPTAAQAPYPIPPDLIEPPRDLLPKNEWFQRISHFWGSRP